MPLRLLESLREHATRTPHAPAVRMAAAEADGALSYRGLACAAWGLASRLARDVREGDVVLLVSPNDAQLVVSFLAILALGARAFPLSPELTDTELLAAAEQSRAAGALGAESVLSALRGRVRTLVPIADASALRAPDPPEDRDVARGGLLLQSSGTTGRPKIVFRDAASLDAVAAAMVEAIGFSAADRVLVPLPLCHSYGIEHGLLAPVMAGSCAHLCRGFDLKVVLKELTDGGLTIFPGVPFMFETLARVGAAGEAGVAPTGHAGDAGVAPTREAGEAGLAPTGGPFPFLRRAYSAGGPLPAGVFQAFRARYGVAVSQLYGATEVGSVMFSDATSQGFDPASVGRAMRGVDVRILDVNEPGVDRPLPEGAEGQVAVRAASMMSGYLPSRGDDDAPPSLVDGFFLTGDLGRMDSAGNLTITGRIKLLIDVGGLKVNPLEVEEVLAQHPEVSACVVLPVRVTDTVCRLKAIVTPREPGAAGPTPESLRRFVRGRLTLYKVPRLFEVRATLPRSPTGKILRHIVAA